MENSQEVPKRQARRKAPLKVKPNRTTGRGRMVNFDDEAFTELDKAAAGLKLSKRAYASAAVLFFSRQNINPTQREGTVTLPDVADKLAMLTTKVGEMQETARKQSADIGNRIVGMWRTLEKNLYGHLSTEQSALLLYLESIEANLLDRATVTESQYLWPQMERTLRVLSELTVTREITSDIYEIQGDSTIPDSKQKEANDKLEQRIQQITVNLSRQLLESVKLTERKKTRRPDLTAAPTSALPPPKVAAPAVQPPVQP